MLTPEKRKEFEARLGAEVVANILGDAERTEKSADAMGVRHKGETMDAADAEVKAEGDLAVDEEIIEEEPADDGTSYVGDMTPDEFVGMLTTALQGVFAPVLEQLAVADKMRGAADELKSIATAYQAQKDATDAERQTQIAALEQQIAALKAEQTTTAATVKELAGEVPAGIQAGYRASVNGPPPTGEALKNAKPAVDPQVASFFSYGQ